MKSPEGNFRGFFCWNDFMDTFAATLFLITAIDPSRSFRMTINVFLIMKALTCFIQGSWSWPSEGAAGARSVRLRILACRNDLNRKRIVSLQLTAHS